MERLGFIRYAGLLFLHELARGARKKRISQGPRPTVDLAAQQTGVTERCSGMA